MDQGSAKCEPHIEYFCNAFQRIEKLNKQLQSSTAEITENLKVSSQLKAIEQDLKKRLTATYACHEVLSEIKRNPSLWSEPKEYENSDTDGLNQYKDEKNTYLTTLDKATKLHGKLNDAGALVHDDAIMKMIHSIEGHGRDSATKQYKPCSEEFEKLYTTKTEVENIIDEKMHKVAEKKMELELLKFRRECRDAFSTDASKDMKELELVKLELEAALCECSKKNPNNLESLLECNGKLFGR